MCYRNPTQWDSILQDNTVQVLWNDMKTHSLDKLTKNNMLPTSCDRHAVFVEEMPLAYLVWKWLPN